MSTHNSSQSGMTLIEVMVALVVFAYAALTLVATSSSHLNAQARLKDKTYASWVAQNQLTEFVLSYKPTSQKAGRRGKTEMAGRTYYFEVKVEDTGSQWLNSVRVDVSSDEEMEYLINSVTGFVEKP